jgi:hypothetical protein
MASYDSFSKKLVRKIFLVTIIWKIYITRDGSGFRSEDSGSVSGCGKKAGILPDPDHQHN